MDHGVRRPTWTCCTRRSPLRCEYAASVDDRRVAPDGAGVGRAGRLRRAAPRRRRRRVGDAPQLLHDVGSPATVASAGRRYFGFVNGATYPVALGSSWLVSAWDQNTALPVMSPVAAKLHDVVGGGSSICSTSRPTPGSRSSPGATVANASCLAAARDALLARLGWDVQSDGLFGAPEIQVVVGERAHSTLSKSLGLVGLGRTRVVVVPADDQGRLRAELLPDIDGPVLGVCPGGRGQHGRVRPVRRDRRLVGGAVGLVARRRARSACGRSPTRAGPISCAASTGPTRGRPTGTSG